MTKENPIVIVRGVHPTEISARWLAGKVHRRLLVRGEPSRLITVPFRKTLLGQALQNSEERTGDISCFELFEELGLDPEQVFFHDFHNYALPDGFGNRYSGFYSYEDPLFTDWRVGNIMYAFEDAADELGTSYEGGFDLRWGVTYEIPAFFKPMSAKLAARLGREIIHGNRQYERIIVDIEKTRAGGFLDERVVQVLADTLIRINREFPKPIQIPACV